mmetsp:Transcript_15187/g.17063  ORF Transcript_15187/g.17063 Transcript_15187/m.17063 type:complete len:181 (-) Transcript_15187:994-1536(-)
MGHPDRIYNDTSSDESYDDYDDFKKKASSSRSFRIKKREKDIKEEIENGKEHELEKEKDGEKMGGGTGRITATIFQRAANEKGRDGHQQSHRTSRIGQSTQEDYQKSSHDCENGGYLCGCQEKIIPDVRQPTLPIPIPIITTTTTTVIETTTTTTNLTATTAYATNVAAMINNKQSQQHQ